MIRHSRPAFILGMVLALMPSVSLAYSSPQEVFDIGDQLQPGIQSPDSADPMDDQTNIANPFGEPLQPSVGEAAVQSSETSSAAAVLSTPNATENHAAAPTESGTIDAIISVRQWLPYVLLVFVFAGSAGLWYFTSRGERHKSSLD